MRSCIPAGNDRGLDTRSGGRVTVRERGHLFLEQLSKQLNKTVHMLVFDHDEVVYVDKVDVHHQPGAL